MDHSVLQDTNDGTNSTKRDKMPMRGLKEKAGQDADDGTDGEKRDKMSIMGLMGQSGTRFQ